MGWLDSTWCTVALYVLVVLLAVALGCREVAQRRSDPSSTLWPTFWFVTAFLLLAMAVGRAADTGQLLTDLGRERAQSEGWYGTRREVQAAVIAGLALVWLSALLIAVWRVPARRRYLPTALTVVTLVAYAGVRLISLHQVDAVLHNRELGGVRLGAIVEMCLLGVVLIVSAFQIRETPARPPNVAWQR